MNNNKTYTAKDFTNYHAGKMPAKEMHALEKAALEDDFLADALEGYAYNELPADDLELLKKKIAAKNKNIFSLASFAQRKWMRIAAMLVIFLGLGYLFFNLNKAPEEKTLAKTESKKETTVSPDLKVDSNKTQPGVSAPNVVSGNKGNKQTENAPILLNDVKEDQVSENEAVIASAPAIEPLKLTEDNSKYINPTQDLTKVDDKSFADTKNQGFSNNNTQNQRLLNNNNQNRLMNATDKKDGGPKQNTAFNKLNNNANNQVNTNKPTFTIPVFDSTANGTIAFNDLYKKSEEKTFKLSVPPVAEKENKNAALEEVVVTGYGNVKRKKEVVAATTTTNISDALAGKAAGVQVESNKSKAAPLIRSRAQINADSIEFRDKTNTFNAYAKKNSKPEFNDDGIELKGTVILSFKTNKKGKPIKIKVIKSLCANCDAQAIELLKNGPAWGTNKNDRQEVTIAF